MQSTSPVELARKATRCSVAMLSTLVIAAIGIPGNAQQEEEPAQAGVLERVVVTATKRSESAQDIPVSISTLQGQDLDQLGIATFQDYLRFLPNVVVMGTGPGQNEVYIRGAATEQSVLAVSSAQGTTPTVALYLDEQPVSFGGRNLDIYVTDLERVEVLPGPQGTLFGASSQAGTLRLITNKPERGIFAAGFKANSYATRGGEMSNAAEGYLNVPVGDRVAVRIAAYNDHQGGWIDNLPNDPDNGGYRPSIEVINRNDILSQPVSEDAVFEAPNNDRLAEDNFNDATYLGVRVGVAYDINEDWELLLQHTQQTLTTEGVFAYDPNLEGESSVNRFTPEENHDEFGLTTWTLNGRLAALDVIYAGGYLHREAETAIDYSGYTNGGGYQVYYLCRPLAGPDAECFDAAKIVAEEIQSERVTQEFRLHTPAENRIRLTTGLFYDLQETRTLGAFETANTGARYEVDANGNLIDANGARIFDEAGNRLTDPDPVDPTQMIDRQPVYIPHTGAFPPLGQLGNVADGANHGGERFPSSIAFANDFTRENRQIALFGQVDFDITPDITASFGVRWYDMEVAQKGTTNSSFGCKTEPSGCDGRDFDNDVSARLRALGRGAQAIEEVLGPDIRAAVDAGHVDVSDLEADGSIGFSDFTFRASLDWKPAQDILLFATYSQGFRPPTANRNAARAANNPNGIAVFENYHVPPVAVTDELDNFELGLKSDLLGKTLRLNLTTYYSDIKDLQTSRFDPSNVAFLVFIENVGDAKIFGLDGEFIWFPTAGLVIAGAFGFVDTELTRINPQLEGISVPKGSELPFTPRFSGNLRVRYDFPPTLIGGGFNVYLSSTLGYTGESRSGITGHAHFVESTAELVYGRRTGLKIANEGGDFGGAVDGACANVGGAADGPCRLARYVQEAYTLFDVAVGVTKESWNVELYINNVTNKRAAIHIDTLQYTPKVVTNRPRTVGLRLSYDF